MHEASQEGPLEVTAAWKVTSSLEHLVPSLLPLPGPAFELQAPVVSSLPRTKTSVESLIGGWFLPSCYCYGWWDHRSAKTLTITPRGWGHKTWPQSSDEAT